MLAVFAAAAAAVVRNCCGTEAGVVEHKLLAGTEMAPCLSMLSRELRLSWQEMPSSRCVCVCVCVKNDIHSATVDKSAPSWFTRVAVGLVYVL